MQAFTTHSLKKDSLKRDKGPFLMIGSLIYLPRFSLLGCAEGHRAGSGGAEQLLRWAEQHES